MDDLVVKDLGVQRWTWNEVWNQNVWMDCLDHEVEMQHSNILETFLKRSCLDQRKGVDLLPKEDNAQNSHTGVGEHWDW